MNLKYEKKKIIIAACVTGFIALAWLCFTMSDTLTGEKIKKPDAQETEESKPDITTAAYRKAIRLRHTAALDPGRGSEEDLKEQQDNREHDSMFRGVPEAVTFFEIAAAPREQDEVRIYDDDFFDVYSNLPPRPESEHSPDGMLGWDTDQDGVRDDVQQTIILKWYKPEYELLRMSLLQLARDYQLAMYDFREGNEQALQADSIRILEDQKCVKDSLAYINERNANNYQAVNEVNAVESSQFDTASRVNIYQELYARLPIDAQDKVMKRPGNYCEFPLGEIPSRRNKNEFRIAGNRSWENMGKKKDPEKRSGDPEKEQYSDLMNFSISE